MGFALDGLPENRRGPFECHRSSTQVLSFPLSTSPELLWGKTALSSFAGLLSFVSLRDVGGGVLQDVSYYAAGAWIAVWLLGFLWVTLQLARGAVPVSTFTWVRDMI